MARGDSLEGMGVVLSHTPETPCIWQTTETLLDTPWPGTGAPGSGQLCSELWLPAMPAAAISFSLLWPKCLGGISQEASSFWLRLEAQGLAQVVAMQAGVWQGAQGAAQAATQAGVWWDLAGVGISCNVGTCSVWP